MRRSCVALVQWGAGEAEAEAEIDFGVGGVVFTLPASSIRITAEYEGNFSAGRVATAGPRRRVRVRRKRRAARRG